MYFSPFQALVRIVISAVLIIWVSVVSAPLVWATPLSNADFSGQGAFPSTVHLPTQTFYLARLDQHQEAPNQILYKAFATLRDQEGHVWRAIAFNHVLPDGSHNFKLRLVGFLDSAAVDRSKPLLIKTALGQSFTTPDDSDHIAIDEGMEAIDVPPNVAQYDLEAIAPRLLGVVPLRLTLPLAEGNVRFLIWPNTVKEWKSVANH